MVVLIAMGGTEAILAETARVRKWGHKVETFGMSAANPKARERVLKPTDTPRGQQSAFGHDHCSAGSARR
jgi:hypothetical protein